MFIKLNNVSKSFGDKDLFENVNLDFYQGIYGVIGENGTGKTTLLNLISKHEYCDTGDIKVSGKLAYLTQLEANKNESPLSYGERLQVQIDKILNSGADILLLDEPTNHLDVEKQQALIVKLLSFNGLVIIVSHDVNFLRQTADHIVEIENKKVQVYNCGYDDYKEIKRINKQSQWNEYNKAQKQEQALNKQIREITNWANEANAYKLKKNESVADHYSSGAKDYHTSKAGKLAKQAKNKKSRLEQLKANSIERPYEEQELIYRLNKCYNQNINFAILNNVSFCYDKPILQNVNLTISARDRIGIIGANGAGKSTLLKIILGQLSPSCGTLSISPQIKCEYIEQGLLDLPTEITVREYVDDFDKERKTLFFTNLVRMGASQNVFNRKISTLSVGEMIKTRLSKLMLEDLNTIILDEPTNHLDIGNREELINALSNFKGCLIVVSHDLNLINSVCNKVYEIKDSQLKLV